MKKKYLEKVVIRFVGDSGDGIQLLGNQFSDSSIVVSGNDIYTFIDFPTEIRAPAGSITGVSGFQLAISNKKLHMVDNQIDILIAFNPAGLKNSIDALKIGGTIILDEDTFTDKNLKRAGFIKNPIYDKLLSKYKLFKIPITKLTYEAVKSIINSVAKAKRCKNFFILGLMCWLFDRNVNNVILWLDIKFKKDHITAQANKYALTIGYNYGETIELMQSKLIIPPTNNYKKNENLIKVSGNKSFCLGALVSMFLFKLPLFSANYPITPASDILHELSLYINKNIKIVQLEDEIAAISAVLGASYGGALAFTCTSGPGIDLMQENLGLAIMAKLPMLLINIQRCGPSTGIPTKSEQTDLLTAVFGRHGESSIAVLAPNSPSDCFWSIIEGFCLAITYLGPVIILSDANLANSFELWKIPNVYDIKKKIKFNFDELIFKNTNCNDQDENQDKWVIPGKKKMQRCIGGLEQDKFGNVSHDPLNHYNMIMNRNKKLTSLADFYDTLIIHGKTQGVFLLITWGSVYGIVRTIYESLDKKVLDISLLCIRYIYPMHNDLENILNNFKTIIIIEENLGQLAFLLKAKYIKDFISINQVSGKPFDFNDLLLKITTIINSYAK